MPNETKHQNSLLKYACLINNFRLKCKRAVCVFYLQYVFCTFIAVWCRVSTHRERTGRKSVGFGRGTRKKLVDARVQSSVANVCVCVKYLMSDTRVERKESILVNIGYDSFKTKLWFYFRSYKLNIKMWRVQHYTTIRDVYQSNR